MCGIEHGASTRPENSKGAFNLSIALRCSWSGELKLDGWELILTQAVESMILSGIVALDETDINVIKGVDSLQELDDNGW